MSNQPVPIDWFEPHKRAVLQALEKTFGNVSQSCKAGGVTRRTYYNWLRDDIHFKQFVESMDYEEIQIDFVESKLMDRINNGDTIAMIFFLKTKGRKRGYVEKIDPNTKMRMGEAPSWFDEAEIVTDQPKEQPLQLPNPNEEQGGTL